MARKVKYKISFSINETERMVLRCLRDCTSARGERVVITAEALSRRVKKSTVTVRRSCASFARTGLISAYETARDDGGRSANAYVITDIGWMVLDGEGSMRPLAPSEARGSSTSPSR